MSLKFTHKPNYFLYADLLIKYNLSSMKST